MTQSARLTWLLLAVVALLGAAILWRMLPLLQPSAQGDGTAADAPAAVAGAAPAAPSATAASPDRPSFDVVRVSPDGTAVLAGRAPPGAQVEVLANGSVIGQAVAAANDGSWVVVLDKPLPPGATELNLTAQLPDGSRTEAKNVLLVEVPLRGSGGQALAVLTPRPGSTDAPVVLQGPDDTAALSIEDGPVLESVDYDSKGDMRLTGRGLPGTTVRLYLDDKLLGDVTVGASGRWQFSPPADIAAGRYRLRLDAIAADGRVAARREMPFERAEKGAVTAAAGARFVVQPGNSLWRIAEQRFGTGYRYVDIYQANRAKIVDPDLIFPGQVFDLPD